MDKNIIAVDAGKAGGFAWFDSEGQVHTAKMPDTMPDIVEFLGDITSEMHSPRIIIENVGFHVQGNSAMASVKFSRHVGNLEAIAYCQGLPIEWVRPQAWMKKLGTLPKEKKDRKNRIKELMQMTYPHLKVTLATADALGILTTMTKKAR